MNFDNPAHLFQIANPLALVGWIWLVVWLFLPKRIQTRSRYIGLLLPIILSLLYAASALVHIPSATGGFDTLAGVQSLFGHAGATLAGWVHYLAFDLLVGWVITQHLVTSKMNRLLAVPCLLLTFMLGPVGVLLYGGLQLVHRLVPGYTWRSQPHDNLWQQVIGGNVVLARCGLLLLLVLPVLLLAYAMDTRTLLEANVWLKPIKFAVSLIVYTLTLSWFSNYLSSPWRDSNRINVYSLIVVMAIVIEMLWIIFAASIGEMSHFNQTHVVLKPVYFLMGLLATVLTSMSLVVGIGILRHHHASLKSLTRYSLGYALITTFFLTMITAAYMAGGPQQSHAVLPEGITVYSEKDSLPLFGWLRDVGDLRVSHFFATHALHFVPLVGWLLAVVTSARMGDSESGHAGSSASVRASWQKTIALLLCILYSVFVLALFIQALMGKPFL